MNWPRSPHLPWLVPQICLPDRASRERWDPVVVARVAEGPQEETITWEHKGSGFTCPQNDLWPCGLLPRRSMTDLS